MKRLLRVFFYWTGIESDIISETKREVGLKMVFASDDFSGDLKEFMLQAGTSLQLYNYIPFKVIKAKVEFIKGIKSKIRQ